MKKKTPFFIGWSGELPDVQKLILKKWVIGIFILLPIVAFVLVIAQRPFNDHIFNFGTVTQHTGIYHESPVPILEVSDKSLPEGVSNYVLLVGFGKMGAEGFMNEIEKNFGSLNRNQMTLQGTLIHGDGKAVLELTKKEKSLIGQPSSIENEISSSETFIEAEKHGEILDPKCYFGVMKPGEGKIHKSCAIRCISGGIPPVFRSTNTSGTHEYSLILGLDGQKINQEILTHVGEQIRMTGNWSQKNGWGVVYIDPTSIESEHN